MKLKPKLKNVLRNWDYYVKTWPIWQGDSFHVDLEIFGTVFQPFVGVGFQVWGTAYTVHLDLALIEIRITIKKP